jgi:Smg protein
MKENVIDVLMYLFETYVDIEENSETDQSELRLELLQAGFNDGEIENALLWLDELTGDQKVLEYGDLNSHCIRIYNNFEHEKLDQHCRGFIAYLEQIGILSPPQRELLIDRLLALESNDIDVEQIKWVVLMVLFSQPGQELNYARMEDLIFDKKMSFIH